MSVSETDFISLSLIIRASSCKYNKGETLHDTPKARMCSVIPP